MNVVDSAPRALVPIQPGTQGPPVYCFHPFGGSAAPYGGLAARLGRDRLVRGLQAVGLAPGGRPDRTVPEMARRYAAEVAADPAAQDARRIVLLGYSMGGVLAVETARLLPRRWPEPVVVLVDCDPRYAPGTAGPWHILVRQVLDVDLLPQRLAGLAHREALETLRAVAAEQRRLPARFSLERLDRMFQVCQYNERAAAAHVPRHYPGTVHVLRTTGAATTGGPRTPAAPDAWHDFAGGVRTHPLPVGHHDAMGPAGYPLVADYVRRLLVTPHH